MTLGFRITAWILPALALLGACSSSSSDGDADLVAVVQDLDLDEDGRTTVLRFSDGPGSLVAGHLVADGGQSAVSVDQSGRDATVVWDARVTPSHRVRVERKGVDDGWVPVKTSDDSPPAFAVTDADQDTSDGFLGGDVLELTFAGPKVVASSAEDVGNWDLVVNGTSMDLTGSTLDFDEGTQVLTMTLGPDANLHATFTIAALGVRSVADVEADTAPVPGVAAGDAVPPTIVSIEQILAQNASGQIVDVVFDEPMDPVFSPLPSRFELVDHPDALGTTLVTNVTQPNDVTLRLRFSRPVAPGYDELRHVGLMDAHGNVLTGADEAIANSNPTANAFDTVTATTVENSGGDLVEVVTDQAFDPDFGADPDRWTIRVNGAPLVTADQTLAYDHASRTLTVELADDLRNGDSVVVDAVGQVDVDGQTFTSSSAPVPAGGDGDAPVVQSVVQNRVVDSTGYTVDVTFSEDVHETEAEDVTNYTFTPAGTVVSADVVGSGNVVRVVTSDLILTPGEVTLVVEADVDDLAGNPLGAPSGPHAPTSTDTEPPAALGVSAQAVEGAFNDRILVSFDDDMIPAEVEDGNNWVVESPIGDAVDVSGADIVYDVEGRGAVVTLDTGGQDLEADADVSATFLAMRDVGGNTIDAGVVAGVVVAETNRPTLHTAWRLADPDDDQLVLRFSEPCGDLEDLWSAGGNPFGVRYAVRDAGGVLRGYPYAATALDEGLGVRLSYGFEIVVGSDTVDVIGVSDLVGNQMFPAMAAAIEGDDDSAPTQSGAPTVQAVVGEDNDSTQVTFSTPMSPWRITDPSMYAVVANPGGDPVDLSSASIDWDGGSVVTVYLDAAGSPSIQSAETYDVTVIADALDPLRSSRGVPILADDTVNAAPVGDVTDGPDEVASLALVDTVDSNTIVVVFDEAVSESDVEVAGNFDYDGGNLAGAVELVAPRVVRATFGVPVVPGFTVVVAQPSAVDLAGNLAAGDVTLAVGTDASGPLLSTVAGVIEVGRGGDVVTVGFSEPVDLVSGLDASNYLVSNGVTLDLSNADFRWDSVSQSVNIHLGAGVELDATAPFSVEVGGVRDAAGNPMAATVNLGGSISGDSAAPDVEIAWVNYPLDGSGTTLDVLFTEDVDPAFAESAGNWSTSAPGVTVQSAERISWDHYRLGLSAPLPSGDTLGLAAGLEDTARNPAGALSVLPVDPLD